MFLEKSRDQVDEIMGKCFIKEYPQCEVQLYIMSGNL